MKVCLISPPIVAEFEGNSKSRADIAERTAEPPVGILSLAALLEGKGIGLRIVDVNHLFCEVAGVDGAESDGFLFARAADAITSLKADIFGFGTLSVSYPLTVRLAAAAKRAHPEALIVIGGPQAAALDIETLEAFPFIDLVVRGEADETFPGLLDRLSGSASLTGLKGITYRTGGEMVRAADAPVVTALDTLPTPAYHLWPGISKCRAVWLEVGRGCPFACTFCSTSPFFKRHYRLKSPFRVIEQMKTIRQAYGVEEFHLIHDTFTVHREKAIGFCEALLESGDAFRWSCSARTDCVDEELLAMMVKAGCIGIFFGVESGSTRIQKAIGKKLDLDRALAAIRCSDICGISSTVSFITGFPDETPEELRATVHFLIDSLRFNKNMAQLHLLAPSAGSALHAQYRSSLLWDDVLSELVLHSWRKDSADYSLIREHPQVFPEFCAMPTQFLERHGLMELRNFVIYGTTQFRWLIIALHQHSGNLVDVFERWRLWLTKHRSTTRATGEYYTGATFRSDFLEFVATDYLNDGDAEALAVRTLLEYEIGIERLKERSAPPPWANVASGGKLFTDLQEIPHIAPGIDILRLSADYEGIIECLRNRQSPRNVSRRPVVVADRQMPDGSIQVIQLSPLSAALIGLCDGTRAAAEIAAHFSQLQDGLDQFPPEQSCLFALNELAGQGLIMPAPE